MHRGAPALSSRTPEGGSPCRLAAVCAVGVMGCCATAKAEVVGGSVLAIALLPLFVVLVVCIILAGITFAILRKSEERQRKMTGRVLHRKPLAPPQSPSTLVGYPLRICLNQDGFFTEIPPSLPSALGYPEQELAQKSYFALTHPNDLSNERQLIDKLSDGLHHSIELDKRFIRRDGSVVWMHVRHMLNNRDDRGTIVTELTPKKHRQDTAQEYRISEETYRSVIQTLDEGLVIQDEEGRIVACNASAENTLGISAKQMMGQTELDSEWNAIYEDGTPFPGHEHPAMETLRTGKACRDQVMGLLWPDGNITWISINTTPIFDPGQPRPHTVVTTFRDVTAQKRAEQRLLQEARFFQNVLDSLPDPVAVIEESGEIRCVNAAWLEGADARRDFEGRAQSVGSNYLQACETSKGEASDIGQAAARGIRDVITGARNEFGYEYPCHNENGEKWFQLRVTRFHGIGPTRVVVIHEDVTEARHIEHAHGA